MYPAKNPTPAANTPHAPARERRVPVLTPEELTRREGDARNARGVSGAPTTKAMATVTTAPTETWFVKKINKTRRRFLVREKDEDDDDFDGKDETIRVVAIYYCCLSLCVDAASRFDLV